MDQSTGLSASTTSASARRERSRAPSVKSSRPGSGGKSRRAVSSAGDAAPAIRMDRAEDEELLEHRRRFQDVEDRRLKEWENCQRSHRSTIGEMRPTVFFDISIGDVPAGRLVVQLFDDVVPQTVANFRALVTGTALYDEATSAKLDYLDSTFHRIESGVAAFGGELLARSLSSTGALLPDENFKRRHTERGLLSTVSRGPNCVGSTFCITLAPAPQLDFIQVVFGKVVDGMSVLEKMEKVEISHTGIPKQPITVAFCGALTGEKPTGVHVALEDLLQAEEEAAAINTPSDQRSNSNTPRHPAADDESAAATHVAPAPPTTVGEAAASEGVPLVAASDSAPL